ncbi:MAG: putative coding region [Ilumatobacteraceae bacterium]|nr:putative coding region [Ilumatobacteraceae bacterium]
MTVGALVGRMRSNLAVIAIIALSTVLHLWQLGRRPLAHDEAIDAFFSWQARSGGVIKYDPVYHGPLRFYIEGFVLDHIGTTPGWTRLVAALAGIAATIVIATSRRLLGRFGAPCAALLFTISPTILTVTRTGREDSLTGLVSLGLLLVVANALIEPRPRHIVGAFALLAISFTLKETTFIFGLAAACFLIGLAVTALLRRQGQASSLFAALRRIGRLPWMWGTVVFIAIFMTVFTSAFRYGEGFESGLIDGIQYWWSQHGVGRGSQHWFFYGTIYAGYEWLLIGAAVVGLVVTIRRRSVVGAWFATMALVQFSLYSWAGEKFAWLALHPLIPAVLLGGLGMQVVCEWVLEHRPQRVMSTRLITSMATAMVLIVLTSIVAVRPAITDGADPRELLVTVQTSTAVPALTDRLAAARRRGTLGPILIDNRDSGAWPWAWYLHDFVDVGYQDIDPTLPLPEGFDAYVVSASTDPPVVPDGYVIERFALRRWWLPDYGHVSVGDIVRWFGTRHTWSPTASSDQFLIVKKSAGVAAADSVAAP